MPDQTPDPSSPAFFLFQKDSFLGLEGVFESRWLDGVNLTHKIIFAILATWVPMVILAALQGLARGPNRSQSILLDPAMYARFLVALPALFYSQQKVTVKLRTMVDHFLRAKLVKDAERKRFIANVHSAMRLCHFVVADWLLLLCAYGYSILFVYLILPQMHGSWRTIGPEGHLRLSLAGWWFIAVSQPV